jgi:uncharacterized protein (TIGR02145 family)
VAANNNPFDLKEYYTATGTLTGLIPKTTYHFRAKAESELGTFYGRDDSFTTITKPSISIISFYYKSLSSITCKIKILSDGGSQISECGVVYSQSQNFSDSETVKQPGSYTDINEITIYNLSLNTQYFIKGFAANSVGTTTTSDTCFTIWLNQPGPQITDIDGNKYNSVKIGGQIWLTENLKVTQYNNGDNVPYVTNASTWENLTTAGYCWYNNDKTTYKNNFGALYNWYVASDPRNICPTGWHVPTSYDFIFLSDFLGGESIAGKELKEEGLTFWSSPNTGATNGSGFSGRPGGARFNIFNGIGNFGIFWSKFDAYFWELNYDNIEFTHASNGRKNVGMSIRCIKDTN